jgi:hypothetical protein
MGGKTPLSGKIEQIDQTVRDQYEVKNQTDSKPGTQKFLEKIAVKTGQQFHKTNRIQFNLSRSTVARISA